MSQSLTTTVESLPWTAPSEGPTTVDSDEQVGRLLTVLDDADCRTILEATGTDPLSANELSALCDIPLSTVYRKLDMLTEADLLAEGTRVRLSGNHTSEYSRRVEEIAISVDADDGFVLELTQREVPRHSTVSLTV